MSAGVLASSVGALVRGSHGAGTMQNATSGSDTVNVNASAAWDTPRWRWSCGSPACCAAACFASAEVGCGGQHPLRRDIRIEVKQHEACDAR